MARTVTTHHRPRPRSRGTARSSTRRVRSRSAQAGVRAPARAPARQREVQAFLDEFTACLTAGDGEGAAACFELPALIVMADPTYGPSQVLQERSKVAEFFGGAKRMYAEKGIANTAAEIERLEWLADGLALVQARFPYLDEDGLDMGDAETSYYVLRESGPGLQIVSAIALGTDADRVARRRRRPIGDVGDQRS